MNLYKWISSKEAIKESIDNSNCRIQIFSKNNNKPGYTQTYDYYKNGQYIQYI